MFNLDVMGTKAAIDEVEHGLRQLSGVEVNAYEQKSTLFSASVFGATVTFDPSHLGAVIEALRAAAHGDRKLRIETNGITMKVRDITEARALFRAPGS